jgi:C4-dicarboxylate-specific signal transduction histidine kinase
MWRKLKPMPVLPSSRKSIESKLFVELQYCELMSIQQLSNWGLKRIVQLLQDLENEERTMEQLITSRTEQLVTDRHHMETEIAQQQANMARKIEEDSKEMKELKAYLQSVQDETIRLISYSSVCAAVFTDETCFSVLQNTNVR